MKIACPKCAETEMGVTSKHDFVCMNGHTFATEDGLLRFADVVALGKAVSHPTRLRILVEFGRTPEMSASEVARRLKLKSVSTARYHILQLVDQSPPLLAFGRTTKNHGADEQKYELVERSS